jgi:short-subunit dehydrogenase
MPLNGKNVYITGGTGGLGKPLVERLRAAGARVTVHDFEKDGDLSANVDTIAGTLAVETPDILINMAGMNGFDYCENQNLRAILDLNLWVPMRLTQAVLPGMKKKGGGHIVNIGSMTALIPLPHFTGYVTSKAGLKAFSDSLRREVSQAGIRVTYIAPRAIKTPMNTGLMAELNRRTHVASDDPADVAGKIFGAILSGKKEMRIGFPERLFAAVNAVCPALVDRGIESNRRIGEEILKQSNL